jgi:hypothetical protein
MAGRFGIIRNYESIYRPYILMGLNTELAYQGKYEAILREISVTTEGTLLSYSDLYQECPLYIAIGLFWVTDIHDSHLSISEVTPILSDNSKYQSFRTKGYAGTSNFDPNTPVEYIAKWYLPTSAGLIYRVPIHRPIVVGENKYIGLGIIGTSTGSPPSPRITLCFEE